MNLTTTPARSGRRPAVTAARPRTGGGRRLVPTGLPWVLPAMILVVGLIYYSIGYTGYTSTLDWDGVSPTPKPVGWGNYAQMLRDPIFYKTLQHTLIYLVATFVIQVSLSFTLAAIMHTKIKLATVQKVIIFVPCVIAPATMAPIFRLFFAPEGLLNTILSHLGLGFATHAWLADTKTALGALVLIHVWQQTGVTFILYYAAMSQITPELLEAARLDGCGNLRALWHVVWPGCRGTTVALAMLGVIDALKTFDIPWLVTLGGPSNATEFLGTYIFRKGIREAHIGYAAALSIALLVLAIGGSILMSRANRKEVS